MKNKKLIFGLLCVIVIFFSFWLILKTDTFSRDTITLSEMPTEIAMNYDTNLLYVPTRGGIMFVINSTDNEIIGKIPISNKVSEFVTVNQETNRIYATSYTDKTIIVIDGNSHIVISKIKSVLNPNSIEINPNTNKIYVESYDPGELIFDRDRHSLVVLDGKSLEIIKTIELEEDFIDIFVNPASNMIYLPESSYRVVTQGNEIIENYAKIFVINGTTDEISEVLQLGAYIKKLAVNPFTNIIYGVDSLNKKLFVINGTNNEIIKTIVFDIFPIDVSINSETNKIYITANKRSTFPFFFQNPGVVFVIDGETNEITDKILIGSGPIDIIVNPHTNLIYAVNDDYNSISVINGDNNEIVNSLSSYRFEFGLIITLNFSLFFAYFLINSQNREHQKLSLGLLVSSFLIFFLLFFEFFIDSFSYKIRSLIPVLIVIPITFSSMFFIFLLIKYEKPRFFISQIYQFPKKVIVLCQNKTLPIKKDAILFLILGLIINFLTMYMISTIPPENLFSIIPGSEFFEPIIISNGTEPGNQISFVPLYYFLPISGPLLLFVLRQIKQKDTKKTSKNRGAKILVVYIFVLLIILITHEIPIAYNDFTDQLNFYERPFYYEYPLQLSYQIGIWYIIAVYVFERIIFGSFYKSR